MANSTHSEILVTIEGHDGDDLIVVTNSRDEEGDV